jgi:hypothetical protein
MGSMGLILLLLLVGFGWFAYRELKLMETDILRDIELKNMAVATEAANNASLPQEEVILKVAESVPEPVPLSGRLLNVIADQPGIMQTDIYSQLPDYRKKQLQQTLQEMERIGVIRREKAKGSYRLFPEHA